MLTSKQLIKNNNLGGKNNSYNFKYYIHILYRIKMTTNFDPESDYTAWLVPMSQIINMPTQTYFPDAYTVGAIFRSPQIYDIIMSQWALPFALSLVLWISLIMISRLQKQKLGLAHTFLTLWIIQFLPVLVSWFNNQSKYYISELIPLVRNW